MGTFTSGRFRSKRVPAAETSALAHLLDLRNWQATLRDKQRVLFGQYSSMASISGLFRGADGRTRAGFDWGGLALGSDLSPGPLCIARELSAHPPAVREAPEQ